MKKALIISYFCLLLFFVLFSYLFVDGHLPRFPLSVADFSNQHREIVTYVYIIFLILSFFFYALFLVLTKNKYFTLKDIKILVIGSIIILLGAYPAVFSYDIFNYLSTSKTLFFYHENPYIVMPIEFVNEPFLSFTRAANKIALYGPFWILLTSIPFLIFSFNVWVFLFGMKILIAVFYIWMILLIYKITKNPTSIVFFSLNPLVMYETLVSSHNDVVMMAFYLLVFLFLQKKQIIISFSFVVFSIFIKYATVILIPIWIIIAYLTARNRKIDWNKVYGFSALAMFIVFLLSPIREEMYPWYAIWFLSFVAVITYRKWLVILCYLSSFGLMLRYLPFMYTGMYHGPMSIYRELLTIIPLLFFPLAVIFLKKR